MRRASFAVVVVALICGIAAPARAQTVRVCNVVNENLWVRDTLSDIYFWYRYLPSLDATRFESPEAYLEAVRYRPIDNTFSYISSKAANDAFFSDSQYIGLGLSTTIVDGEVRVLQVFPESPAEDAGLIRGAWIREINGRPVADLIETGEIENAFGPAVIGAAVDVVFEIDAQTPVETHLVKRLVTIPTVSLSQVYNVGGRNVGYVFFRNFVQPSAAALDKTFATLRRADVRELVLDLRYNGGGLVTVAQHLASLIGGARTDGQVFAEYVHNDRNSFRNSTIRFEDAANALGLTRLIVITTRSSASASELVINALRPFIPVVVIGDRTYGKPVGQYAFPFCDKVLAPVSFTLRNARGEGDYFGGIAPQCPAADDPGHQLGDIEEASLHEALTFVQTGACSAPPTATRLRVVEPAPRVTGWQSVVNAY